jgi:Legionella pneumophila major outer membrane protein precursor
MEEMGLMRSKTGWCAMLLAGVALAPAGAWAQPGVEFRPDPDIPIPLGHPRMDVVGGWYTALEYVMFRQTNPIRRQLLAVRGLVDVDGAITGDLNGTVVNTDTDVPFIIRGPVVPGNFLGTGTPALFSDDLRGQESYQPGFRMTLGYRFNSGSALEGTWMHLMSAKYAANASLIPPNYANLAAGGGFLADTFLFLPFFNLPPEFAGANQELAIGNPGSAFGIFNGAINASIDFTQRFDQGDVRGRVPWYQSECMRCYTYAGGRFAWIWERFHLRAVSADFNGNSAPTDVGSYNNIVSNRMYGAFAGLGVERYVGYGFAVGLEMEAAGLVDVVKERATLANADRNPPFSGVPRVQLKKSATNFAVTPEVATNAQLFWYPWEGVQIRAGYNFMAFFNTIAAQDPVAFDARSFDPDWHNKPVRFFDGFNVGIGFIF